MVQRAKWFWKHSPAYMSHLSPWQVFFRGIRKPFWHFMWASRKDPKHLYAD